MALINQTLTVNSTEKQEVPSLPERILLVFYCLIFIFGLIGI
jgi:hypothetical protein